MDPAFFSERNSGISKLGSQNVNLALSEGMLKRQGAFSTSADMTLIGFGSARLGKSS